MRRNWRVLKSIHCLMGPSSISLHLNGSFLKQLLKLLKGKFLGCWIEGAVSFLSEIDIQQTILLFHYYNLFTYIGNIFMKSFLNWAKKQLDKEKINPLWRLFLTGVKGQMETTASKPYGYYTHILSLFAMLSFGLYVLGWKKKEMDVRGYNIFIPELVYRVREESHIYWETVRIAQGLPTTFNYYKWGDNVMFEIDRKGTQTPVHVHRQLQNSLTFSSPLHEYNFPAKPEKHSEIILYLKNLNNPYELKNYLRAKPINMGDWIRSAYYWIYRELGLSNRWRYDEFVRKPSIYYRWEKIKLAFLIHRDREKLFEFMDETIPSLTKEDILSFFVWFL